MSTTPLPSFDLEVRESLESELTRKLMDYLITSGVQPGERLPSERQMSERLGVGRAALRHSIKALSLLGVVDIRPSNGTFMRNGVSDLLPRVIEWGVLLGEKRTEDIIEARYTLEVALAGFAADRRTPQDVEHLATLIKRMEQPAMSVAEYVDLDVQFHLAIADTARNEVLAGVLRSLQSLLYVWATRVIASAGETTSSLAMHIPILEAIAAGDAVAARESMRAHMERASRRLHQAVAVDSEAKGSA